MASPISSYWLSKPPQYTIESAYGIFPTAPKMEWIGSDAMFQPRIEKRAVPVPKLRSEQIAGFGTEMVPPRVRIDYVLQETVDSQRPGTRFAQFGANPYGEANSPSSSLSILAGVQMGNGIERFWLCTGARTDWVQLSGLQNDEIRASQEFVCADVKMENLPPDSIVYATDPKTPILNFSSGGQFPVIIGGRNLEAVEITATIQRGLRNIPKLRSSSPNDSRPTTLRASGRLKLNAKDSRELSYLRGLEEDTLIWGLKPSGPSLTITGTRYERLDSYNLQIGQTITETYAFTGKSARVT